MTSRAVVLLALLVGLLTVYVGVSRTFSGQVWLHHAQIWIYMATHEPPPLDVMPEFAATDIYCDPEGFECPHT